MVVNCSVCGEQYGVTEDVTFHKFPANEERRKKWILAVQRSNWTPAKRSMLCSNHFSRDKFVYKVSGDKVRRYLMPDTVPTIFDRNKKKSSNGSQQLNTSNKSSISDVNSSTNFPPAEVNSVQPDTDITATDVAGNSNRSLNLEILAATSVGLEPEFIAPEAELIQVEKCTADAVSQSVEISETVATAVPSSSLNISEEKDEREGKRLVNLNRATKRSYHGMKIENDLTTFPKRSSRQVYPGDFKQLNYNDITEVSKSWTVLNNYIKKMRTNMKVLRQRNRRLEKRVTDLKSVVKFLKNRIVAKDSAAVRLCGNSHLPVPTKPVSKQDRLYRTSNPLIDHDYIFVDNKKSTE